MKHFFKHYFEKKYFGIYRHAKKLFIIDIFLLILAIFLFGTSLFFLLYKPSIIDKIQINFAYSSQEIISGQDLDISLSFKNNSKVSMEDTWLSLQLPPGFVLNKAKNQQLSDSNTFSLGTILAGNSQKITISGQIVGNVTKNDKILAILSYKIGKTNQTEKKEALDFIKYSGSQIKSELSLQQSAFPDREVPFSIKLANLSQNTISGIHLELPNYAKLSQKFPFELKSNEIVTLSGVAKIPKVLGSLPFTYKINREFNNEMFTQESNEVPIKILNPAIGLKIIPETTLSYTRAGDIFPVHLMFDNLSGNLLQNQTLLLRDINGVVDLSATARENGISHNDQGLIIDKNARIIFSDGSSVKSDNFSLYLKIKKDAGFISSDFKSVPEFSAQLFQSEASFYTLGNELNLKIYPQISLVATARYYTKEGDQLGRGPLPPQTNNITKYWIYLDIKNGATPLLNCKITAKTGQETTVGDKQSVSYGPSLSIDKNAVFWNKEKIDAFTTFGLYFEVAVAPTANNIGKNIILLDEIILEAIDPISGKQIKINLGKINNQLQDDDAGRKFGSEVVK